MGSNASDGFGGLFPTSTEKKEGFYKSLFALMFHKAACPVSDCKAFLYCCLQNLILKRQSKRV